MRFTTCLTLLASLAIPTAAFADSINLSTGMAAYTVVLPGGTSSSSTQIITPNAAWTAVVPGASWINNSGNSGAADPAGIYTYSTTFTGGPGELLSGLFASDNNATVEVENPDGTFTTLSSNSYNGSYQTATSFSDTLTEAGQYELLFVVTNGNLSTGGSDGAGPTGLIASANVTPEPSSLILLGTGLLGVVGMGRRKLAKV